MMIICKLTTYILSCRHVKNKNKNRHKSILTGLHAQASSNTVQPTPKRTPLEKVNTGFYFGS